MAASAASKVAVSNLGPEHLEAFDKTLRRIMMADHAKYTLAQIIDGIPTRDVYYDYGYYHRETENHLEPNPESVEMIEAFQEDFRPDTLYVESDLAQAYQNTSIGSRQFQLRLLEMVATAFHTAVAILFDNTDSKPYKNLSPSRPTDPTNSENDDIMPPPIPTFFYHSYYLDHDQYPLGVADMVGYWAETQVFGGVVLFDRGESDTECREAFLHPNAHYAIFQLSQTQLDQFVDFALQDGSHQLSAGAVPCPLPIHTEKYARRVDPSESMHLHIFRNRYERKPPRTVPGLTTHPRRRLEDFPEIMDFMAKLNEGTDQD